MDGIMRTSPTQDNIIDRMFGWWYAIAAPPAVSKKISQRTGYSIRKGRYTSLVLLIEIIDTFLTYFVNISIPLIISLTISIFMLFIGVYLNRIGKTVTAGWVVVVTIELSMIAHFLGVGFGEGGLSLSALPTLIILIQPQLVAISLFPPKISLVIAIFNCAVMTVVLTFFPKTHETAAYIASAPFDSYFTPIGALIFVSLISLLWSNSALREMQRADQSEEVTKLARDIMKDPGLLKMMLDRLEKDKQRTPRRGFADEAAYWNDANEGWW